MHLRMFNNPPPFNKKAIGQVNNNRGPHTIQLIHHPTSQYTPDKAGRGHTIQFPVMSQYIKRSSRRNGQRKIVWKYLEKRMKEQATIKQFINENVTYPG